MDPKYTEQEEVIRQGWKRQAAHAQEGLLKVKADAIAREKKEREEKVAKDHAKQQADKAAAERRINAQGLAQAVVDEVKKLERTHGVRVTSHESSTTIHGQQTITVQFTKVAAPRTFTPYW